MAHYLIALDQGTTSSRCIIFDQNQNIVCARMKELTQYYPAPGWVEHDPAEICASQISAMHEAIDDSGIALDDIAAIGIANQRETAVIWERTTGRPVMNAIVWQCRRTADICERIKADAEFANYIAQSTGLLADAYFSATKYKWILDEIDPDRRRARNGELLAGTIDTWLVWNLTEGAAHVTDRTNASRTMLYDIVSQKWDKNILDRLNIPIQMLPRVTGSSEVYGHAEIYGRKIPIAGMAGDQQAALFGQACFEPGQAKNTYGTGCFLLANIGEEFKPPKDGIITTLCATTGDKPQYAYEGSVFMGGAIIQWLRDELHMLNNAADSQYFAEQVKDNGDVYIVPAFTGLGAPYWDMYARGLICGLTRGSNSNHIIRAALEAIAYRSNDLVIAMENSAGLRLQPLKVDGGASANDFLMQFQADITDIDVIRPKIRETTALGAAYLAGLAVGAYKNTDEIATKWSAERVFEPNMDTTAKDKNLAGWANAVRRARG